MSVEAALAMLSLCGTQQVHNTLLGTDTAVVTTDAGLSHNCLSLYIMPVTVERDKQLRDSPAPLATTARSVQSR